MKNSLGLPTNVAHWSELKGIQTSPTSYIVSNAHILPSWPCDITTTKRQSWSVWSTFSATEITQKEYCDQINYLFKGTKEKYLTVTFRNFFSNLSCRKIIKRFDFKIQLAQRSSEVISIFTWTRTIGGDSVSRPRLLMELVMVEVASRSSTAMAHIIMGKVSRNFRRTLNNCQELWKFCHFKSNKFDQTWLYPHFL
jgi:hypothetical protein